MKLGKSFTQFFGVAVLVPLLLAAPVQCPSQREPRREQVEPPAEAVYQSAVHLRELGYIQAERATLEYLIENYPGTRWSERARLELSSSQQQDE